jgi:UDP-galactopyranose mutase
MKYDFAIVGAGFAVSVCAEQLGSRGKRVLLIDARPHIGGNAYDERDRHGVLVHPYGPHIFHANSKRVFSQPIYRLGLLRTSGTGACERTTTANPHQ